MSGETHYGVLYPSRHVADFDTDRQRAVTEYQTLLRKNAGVRLVQRKVGPWHPVRATAEGGNQR